MGSAETNIETIPEGINPLNLLPDETIPIEDILEYRAKGLTYEEIGTLLGCTKSNICQRLKPYLNEIQGLDNYKKHRADVIAIKGRKILNSLTDEDIQKTPAGQRVMMYGILYDKERLERGQSTTNLDIVADIIAVQAAKIGHNSKAGSASEVAHKALKALPGAQDTADAPDAVLDNLPIDVSG